MGIPIFRYEKIELLVCIYEIPRELVFIYGILWMEQSGGGGGGGGGYPHNGIFP